MGLLNRIKGTNVIRNIWTQIARITVICGLLVATAAAITCNQGDHCGLAFVSVAAIFVVAVVFIAWSAWFTYVVWVRRHLSPMLPKGYKMLDSINFCLFSYWIVASIFKIAIGAWVIPIVTLIWMASIYIALKYKTDEAKTI